MAYVKSATKAAWDALSKSTTESTLGLIENTHEAVRNGVNVFVKVPKVGDIVLHDSNNNVAFIALDSYKSLPTGYTLIGVVAALRGKKVLIAHKANASKKWADVYEWKISGWSLDGSAHTTSVVLHTATAVNFTYTASSLSEVATQLNTWLASNQPSDYTYKARVVGDELILTLLTYSAGVGTNTFSGLTVDSFTGTELDANSSIYWDRTRTTYWAQMNAERFYAYYKTNGRTPDAQVPLNASPADPVKQTEFNTNAYCDLLRAAYCADASDPTDDDYKAYLKGEFPVVCPDMRGILAPAFQDGKASTYALVGKTYEDENGDSQPKYPAAEYCAAAGFSGVEGLEPGDWFLPSMLDLYEIIGPVTYPAPNSSAANADALNRSLNAIGGSQIGNGTYFWTSCRYDANIAWSFNGGSGEASSYYFYDGYTAVPVALYEIPAGN